MSWKQSGGIKQFDAAKNINVNAISTDNFTMREAYKGTFKILGEFFVSQDCSLNGNVNIGENAIIEKDLFVKNTILIGDVSLNTNIITSSQHGQLGIGINVMNPIALLDISGNSAKIMNVYSSLPNVNSTLLRNSFNDQTNITLDNNRTASLSFVMGGNTISIEYDLSKDLISVNRDVSFIRTVLVGGNANIMNNLNIGKTAVVSGNLVVFKDVSMGGNFSLGGHSSIRGNLSITGDMSMNGNATIGRLVLRNGLTINNDTNQNGNVFLGSDSGLFFNDLNRTDAIIRKYKINTDGTRNGLITSDNKLYLNSDVVIGGNLYIDGSTNLIGNITYFGGSGGGSGSGNSLDASGRLVDLSGTDQTRFYVNHNSNELSDNDLKGAGFYIYNNYIFGNENCSFNSLYNHGFIKVSDVCCNKLSIRTVGDPNVVSMDLSKMKNERKSGLLVLKYVTGIETDYNDNYNIVSSHTDLSAIDVSNSFIGVKSINVENLISCDKDIFVGNSLFVNGNLFALGGTIGDVIVGNLYLQNNLILSTGVSFSGNIQAENVFLDNLYLNKDIYLSDTSVIRGNLLSCVKDVYVGNDMSIHGNMYVASETNVGNIFIGNLILNKDIYLSDTSVIRGNLLSCVKDVYVGNDMTIHGNMYVANETNVGNIFIGNLILNKDIYLSDNSVIHGNLAGILTVENLIVKNDITIQENLKVLQNVSIDGMYTGNSLILNFGSIVEGSSKYFGNCDVVEKILAIQNSVIGNAITASNENKFENKNTFNSTTIFQANADFTSIFVNNDISCSGDIKGGNGFFHKNVVVSGNIYLNNSTFISGKTSIVGNVDISGNMIVSGLSTFYDSVTLTKHLSIGGSGNLYVAKMSYLTDVSVNNNIFIGNNLTLCGDFNSSNGNVYINKNAFIYGNLDISGSTFTNQTYVRGNMNVSGLSTFNDSVTLTKHLSIGGSGNLYVAKMSYLTDVSVNNNMFIGNNLTLGGDFNSSNGNVYINKNAFIYGNLDILGSTFTNQTYVRGNIEVYGNFLHSNGFAVFSNSLAVTKDLSLGANLYVSNAANVYELTASNNISVGKALTVSGDTTIYGNIVMNGSTALVSNDCTFNGNVAINHDLYIIGNKSIHVVGGDIYLNDGNLSFLYNASYSNITPKLFNNLLNVKSDIQKQIDDIKDGSDVNKSSYNEFTNDNQFTANVIAKSIDATSINASIFTITKSLTVKGETANEAYVVLDNTSSFYGKQAYVKRNKSGKISTNDNIYCVGEELNRFIFEEDSSLILDNDGVTLSASGFYDTFAYSSEKGLYYINGETSVPSADYTMDTHYEGGMVSCLDISLSRNFYMNGQMYVNGNFYINDSVFTPAAIESALNGSGSGSGSGGSVNIDGIVENEVTFGNIITFDDSIVLYGDVILGGSSLLTLTQDTLSYLADIRSDVQDQIDSANARTTFTTMTISGNVSMTSGSLNLTSGNVSMTSGSLNLTSGNVSMTSGSLNLTSGNVSMTSGSLNLTSGNVSMTSGSLNLTSGNVSMTSGSLNLTSGNVSMTSGSLNLTSGSVTAVSFNATSDYRLKYDIQTISGSYYTVDNLRPVTYSFKLSQEPHIGFIAHELQEHFPTAVHGEKDGIGMQSVNYAEIIPVLVKEIQELKKDVQLLMRGAQPP
jgi:predicted acyltransferase (DUF342 family)/lipopolysaccharide export system protein LptA